MAMSYCLPDPAHFPPARRHPRANDIRAETDAYFADAWPWRSSEELSKFQLSNFAGYTTSSQCVFPRMTFADFDEAIPDASYDRALWCSKVFALLFVGDDLVEVEVLLLFPLEFLPNECPTDPIGGPRNRALFSQLCSRGHGENLNTALASGLGQRPLGPSGLPAMADRHQCGISGDRGEQYWESVPTDFAVVP
jgi:hypothetical protein